MLRVPAIIAGYFVFTLVLGAALAPWLWRGSRWMVEWIAVNGLQERSGFHFIHHHVGRADFTRVFNRAQLIAAVSLLWPAFRLLRAKRGAVPAPAHAVGLVRSRWLPWIGFLAGAALLLAMGWFFLGQGWFTARTGVKWGKAVTMGLQKGLGAGLAEEWFFRGALMGMMLRAGAGRPKAGLVAWLFVTTLFAAVHFLKAPEDLSFGDPYVHAGTGFWLIGVILAGFGSAKFLLAEFCTLWVAGGILGWLRLRTGSVWPGVGLHAGWVFGITIYGFLARTSKAVGRGELMPWIGDDLKTGLIPLLVLAATWGLFAAGFAWRRGRAIPLSRNAGGESF